MKPELPTPRRVAVNLAGVGLATVGVQGALLIGFIAAASGSSTAPGPVTTASVWVLMAPLLVPLVTTLAVTAQTLSRTAPLYRVACHRAGTDDSLPPSPTALSDATQAARWMKARIGLSWVVPFVLFPWIVGTTTDAPAVMLFTLGIVAAGAAPLSHGIRRILRPWLTAFPPTELASVPAVPYEGLASFHAAMVVGSIGLVATALALRGEPGGLLPLAVGLPVTLGLSYVAHRLASRAALSLVRDVENLRRRVSLAVETPGLHMATDSQPSVLLAGSDPAVARIGEELDRVMEGLSASADVERQVKSTIEESRAQKTIFMASMSHDLRSPLNSIMGFSELLSSGMGGELTPGQRENVAIIQRSSSELLELLNDIIDTARLDAGRLPLRRGWVPMVALLGEATKKGREMVALRTGTGDGFTIEEELEPGLPPVHIDRARIVQALLCVFRHATRAMEGGAIRLSARSAGKVVLVVVTDSGPPIQDEDRRRVFDAFHSITSVSGHRIGGMGLALSLARSLVRAHGGDVHYDALADRGTAIVLSIPTLES